MQCLLLKATEDKPGGGVGVKEGTSKTKSLRSSIQGRVGG